MSQEIRGLIEFSCSAELLQGAGRSWPAPSSGELCQGISCGGSCSVKPSSSLERAREAGTQCVLAQMGQGSVFLRSFGYKIQVSCV